MTDQNESRLAVLRGHGGRWTAVSREGRSNMDCATRAHQMQTLRYRELL